MYMKKKNLFLCLWKFKKEKPIFVNYETRKKTGGAHFDFCCYALPEEEYLFVPLSRDAVFFKEYLKYLDPTETPNGQNKFDGCGINFYTKEQTIRMAERIRKDKPKEYEVLLAWLEKVIEKQTDFFIHGV